MPQGIPDDLVVFEGTHWTVNQRIGCPYPGFLIIAAKCPTSIEFSDLSELELTEMGCVIGRSVVAVERTLKPAHVYVCRFGHYPNCTIHFQVVPVYEWVKVVFHKSNPIGGNPGGPNMLKYIEDYLAFGNTSGIEYEPTESFIARLRQAFAAT